MMQKYPAYKDSCLSFLGDVPSHWELVRLDRLFNLRREEPKEEDEVVTAFIDGRVTLRKNVKPTGLKNAILEHGWQRVYEGDLAISGMNAHLGGMGISDSTGKCSPIYLILEPTRLIEGSYFSYLLRHIARSGYIRSIVKTIRYNSADFKYGDVKNLYVCLPNQDEQIAIARYLEEQTAVINQFLTNKRQLIALLEEQKQVVINTAVTHGLDPNAPCKPSGIDWLGDIPTHWEIKKIGYISEVGNGFTPSRSNMRYWQDGTYPWLNSSSVNQGVIVEADQFVTPTALKECHLPIVKPNSILIAITGQGKTRGTAALLTFEATINQHMAYITPLPKVITSDYLVTFLQGNYNYLRYISDGQGGTKGALTCGDIKQLKIPVPPPAEQEIIVERVKQTLSEINTAIERTQREIELIEEYRTTLIATAVTGKIDVRGARHGP